MNTVQEKEIPFPSPSEYRKLSLEERAKILPAPSDDQMTELKAYQKRMGYDEKSSGIKYKMSVFDDFQKEYEYRKKKVAPQEFRYNKIE